MERFDVSEGDRLAEMVEAAQSGEEVEIMAGDKVVAHLTVTRVGADEKRAALSGAELVARLEALRRELPPAVFAINWTDAVRQMRDED